jgi:hypothetical protein
VWLTNPSTLLQWGAPLWNVGEGSEHKGGRNQDAVRRWIRAEKGNFKFAPSSAVARLWSLKRCDRRSSAAPFWDRAKEARTKRAGISDTACRWIRAEKSNPDFPRAPKDERASPTPLPRQVVTNIATSALVTARMLISMIPNTACTTQPI